MASSIAAIRAIANTYLKRVDGSTRPWADADVNQAISDTLDQLWPDFGVAVYGETPTTAAQLIAVPVEFTANAVGYKISRIIVKNSAGTAADKASGWQAHPGGFVFIKTIVASGNTFGFYGFTPYLNDASNLPARLNSAIAARAAGFAWGNLGAELVNSEIQQTIDSGRVVTSQQALAMAAYYERRFQDATQREPTRLSYAPRASNRSR